MKICIVGGTGNISTSIVNALLKMGHQVTCFNRGKSGRVPPGVHFIRGDRNCRETFERSMSAEQFEAVIDMICFNREDAVSSIKAFPGVRHFIQCSTVCTYGIKFDWLPVSEDHPLRPIDDYGKNKVEADSVFLEAYYRTGFPVTIVKPGNTYGPKEGLVRQIAEEFSWIDRIRKGKPILICGDGNVLCQHLHVDDAALAFANIIGQEKCIGQTYNLVNRDYITWRDYHLTAMKVLGHTVGLVGVPLDILEEFDIPHFEICPTVFAHHGYYSSGKIFRDVPSFNPAIDLETGMRRVIEEMDKENRITNSDLEKWEDPIVQAQLQVKAMAPKNRR